MNLVGKIGGSKNGGKSDQSKSKGDNSWFKELGVFEKLLVPLEHFLMVVYMYCGMMYNNSPVIVAQSSLYK